MTINTDIEEVVDGDKGYSTEQAQEEDSSNDVASMILGRWVLVNSEISTPFMSFVSGEMVITHQLNEKTGGDEFITKTSWKIIYCCLPCIKFRGTNTSITRITDEEEDNSFTVTDMKTGIVDYPYCKREGSKFTMIGEKGTTVMEYKGDKCYGKIVDPRYSLYINQEWDRIETFTAATT